jgi:hypothetical protein
MTEKPWKFVHNSADEAQWTPGLREIFEYRDLGIKGGTNGDYVAHVIKHREIACSKDFEVLEIVSPANFKTRIVDAPADKPQAAE